MHGALIRPDTAGHQVRACAVLSLLVNVTINDMYYAIGSSLALGVSTQACIYMRCGMLPCTFRLKGRFSFDGSACAFVVRHGAGGGGVCLQLQKVVVPRCLALATGLELEHLDSSSTSYLALTLRLYALHGTHRNPHAQISRLPDRIQCRAHHRTI